MTPRIWRAVLAIATGLAASVAIIYVAPTLSWFANGQNIVGTPDAAAQYVGTSVGFLGAIVGAGSAFVAYELQKRDQQATRARVCALLVKTSMRAALEEMFGLFEYGVLVVDKVDRPKFIGGVIDASYVPEQGKVAHANAFLGKCAAISASLSMDSDAADALAHLDRKALSMFLMANSAWERLRTGARPAMSASEFRYAFHWLEIALDSTLRLNAMLNELIFDQHADVIAKSTEAWLDKDNVPLPV